MPSLTKRGPKSSRGSRKFSLGADRPICRGNAARYASTDINVPSRTGVGAHGRRGRRVGPAIECDEERPHGEVMIGGRYAIHVGSAGARAAHVNSMARRRGDTTPRLHVGDPSASSDSNRLSPRLGLGVRLETKTCGTFSIRLAFVQCSVNPAQAYRTPRMAASRR
jgi:hypothetical protein